ncbi:MAG: hypothetical protein E7302_05735 [Butyrivibrio sp.]|nr:hypothetical protein [Butyrivibrio sp.]
MKRFTKLLLMMSMFVLLGMPAHAATPEEISALDTLITRGNNITNPSASDAYVWVNDVNSFNESYKTSSVYSLIKNNCSSVKSYTSINDLNYRNRILGAMMQLRDELSGAQAESVSSLISTGQNISNNGPLLYKWILDVSETNELNKTSFAYNNIKSSSKSFLSYTDYNDLNYRKRILGALKFVEDESTVYTISQLIATGNSITDRSSPDAYKWVLHVSLFNENNNTSAYQRLKNNCNSVLSYTDIDDLNYRNRILGALLFITDESTEYTASQLIVTGNSISDRSAPEAYKWVLHVINFNENNRTSVYQSLKNNCNSVLSYTNIDDLNYRTKILADLSTAELEAPVSSVLSGITITTNPTKTIYNEDEKFSPSGMVVTASFLNTYSNNQTNIVTKIVSNYTVDTTTPLKSSNTQWLVTYTSGGITKTAYVNITVKPYEILRYLDSISLVYSPSKTIYYEGEYFSSTGARIDATYTVLMSDQTRKTETASNVQFTVSNTNPLTKADTTVTLSVTYNNVTREVSIPISVIERNGDLPEQHENNQGQNQNGESESEKTEEPDSPQQEEIHNGDAIIIDGSEYIVNTKKKTVVLNEGAEKSIFMIPAVVSINKETYKVVGIADSAFEENEVIKKVKGGENLVSIGAAAFYGCPNLAEVDLSKTKVKSIKAKTFKDCPKLKKLTINGKYLKSFGKGSLYNTKKKMKIYIKEASNKQYKSLSKKIKKAGNKTVVVKKK